MRPNIYILFILIFLNACTVQEFILPAHQNILEAKAPPVVTYLTGDATDVNTVATPGFLLMGGGVDVDEAILWFLQRSGGGDIVVIRASGADGYNSYMFGLSSVNSVETIIIDSRAKAGLAVVTDKIRNAEALFIAGGDQSDYVNFWKGTGTQAAINYLINTKKVTVGGTSAGLAILGSDYYSALKNSAISSKALSNPYYADVTLGHQDFITSAVLSNLITDSHYSQRDRLGRHIVFMARIMKDYGNLTIKGVGIDEQTAVCIDANGVAKVFGTNNAYFLKNNNLGPETCISGSPLTWNRSNLALTAYRITGSTVGNGQANFNTWTFSGGTASNYYVTNGTVIMN